MRKRIFFAFFIVLSIASLYGQSPAIPSDALPVPKTIQTTDYSCGAAALASVLKYWDVFKGQEKDLFVPLNTTKDNGTNPFKIVEVAAAKFHLKATCAVGYYEIGDLKAFLDKGIPVIMDIQAYREKETLNLPWREDWEDGHFVVLIGIDSSNIYVMDPSADPGGYAYFPIWELIDRWHDYDNMNGGEFRHHRMAIVIKGKNPIRNKPEKWPTPIRLN